MIMPVIIGTVASRKSNPVSGLDIEISLDGGTTWTDGPVTDPETITGFSGTIDPITGEVTFGDPYSSYFIKALGTGSEGLSASSDNPNFYTFLGSSTINGNDPANTLLEVYYSGPAPAGALITISSSGGDIIYLTVSGS